MANLLVDLDDTLIHTCRIYDEALAAFGGLMAANFPHFYTPKEAEDIARRVDITNTPYKWVMHRFPGSLGMAYLEVVDTLGTYVNPCLLAQSVALGYRVFQTKAEPVDGAGDVLAYLHGCGHRLYLYTMGERQVQEARITQLGYASLFKDVGIVDSKDVDTLKEFMRVHRMDPAHTYAIGDSLRSDIAPAVAVGLQAIYITPANSWVFSTVEIDGEYHTLPSIKHLPGMIEKLEAK